MKRNWLLLSLAFLPVALRAQESLTLEQAVRSALSHNPALKAVEQESAVAEARLGQVKASRFPRLDFSQAFTRGNNQVYVFGTLLTQRQFTAAHFALSQLNAPHPLDNFQARFDGQVLLFDFGRTRWRISGARDAQTAAEHQIEQARQDLILRVIQAYSSVLVARQNLAAAREAVRSAEAGEQQVASRQEVGLVVTSDLLSAQVFRAQMKDRELRAANALDLALLTLSREMGAPPEELRPQPSEELAEPEAPAMSLQEWENVALKERPALLAAQMEQQAVVAGKRLAKAEFGPRLGAFANFERDAETLSGPSGANWSAGAKLDWNVFSGGARRYAIAEAQARERQSESNLQWLRSGVRLEVRQGWLETQSAAQRAEAARQAVEQARESLRIVQSRYDAGLVTITELLRAQAAQLDAATARVAALGDWQAARARLERAAGRLTVNSSLLHPGGQR
ncbi:MAG: TolC family protein [Acidobacteria bacterium]|nr:TolC family protein [Acidobacteriota bacterium]